jgi:hypothetical protein
MHPDSLDARERLARHLAGASGPGIPPAPFPCELPPKSDLGEALGIFLATASARAGDVPDGQRTVPPGSWRAQTPFRGPRALRLSARDGRFLDLLESSGDERAFAAAASAAECELLLAPEGPGEHRVLFLAVTNAAAALVEGRPAFLRLCMTQAGRLLALGEAKPASKMAMSAARMMRETPDCPPAQAAGALFAASRICMEDGKLLPAAVALVNALSLLEPPDPGGVNPGGLTLDRAGRDRLAARLSLAECAGLWSDDPAATTGLLAPFLSALPDLPPGREGPGAWPWPPELAGMALAAAAEAASRLRYSGLGDSGAAAAFDRRALDTLDPDPADPSILLAALERLPGVLADTSPGKPDAALSREIAGLHGRAAELMFSHEGPDSLPALERLFDSAACLAEAGETENALALFRKVLEGRSRLLGPHASETRACRSRARDLERLLGQDR